MAWSFSITLDDDPATQALAALNGRSGDLRPALDAIGESLMLATDLRFEREEDPDGSPWAPLAPATAKRKAKLGHERILQLSGRLRGSITRTVDESSVTVGTNLPYARIHQLGGEITKYAHSRQVLRRFVETKGGGRQLLQGFARRAVANFASWHEVPEHAIRIPARPFLGINDDDRENAVAVLLDHILGRAR
jgi:phage virion morphogenesis protein